MDRAVIGVDLGGTNMRTAVLDKEALVISKQKEETLVSGGREKVIARMIRNIRQQYEAAADKGYDIVAVGVGAPGVILEDQGIVVKSPNFPDWNNLPLKAELERDLSVPVFIENDANAAALGEQWRGAGRGIDSMILLTLGTGVGGGIILNNRIWHGADGMAGEIGHMTIFPEGRACSCGNRGCLEMYASARGIIRTYQEKLGTEASAPQGITSEQIYQSARKGDPIAVHAMTNMGMVLGIGIANLINIFNPEKIVIGGGVKDAWALFIDSTLEEIRQRAFEAPAKRAAVVPSLLGDEAGVIGSAALAFQKITHKS